MLRSLRTLFLFASALFTSCALCQSPAGAAHQPGVTPPELIKSADAKYPHRLFIRTADKSQVTVALTVDQQGRPQDVHVDTSGGKDFDRSAIDAVQKYRFKPAMKDGHPIAVPLKVEIDFFRMN